NRSALSAPERRANIVALGRIVSPTLQHGADVGSLEVLSFKEERFVGNSCECVREAVAEVQSCLMAPLAEIVKGLAGDMGLFNRKRFDNDAGPAEKHIALSLDLWPGLTLNDYRELQKGPGADQAPVSVVDELGVAIRFRLTEEDSDKCRGIQNHFGRPAWS